MIKLKPNADQQVRSIINDDGVIAFYYSICEKYYHGYVQTFITDFQVLITKLGITMSKVSTQKRNISYCFQAIGYLTRTVLNKPDLEKKFNSLGVNNKGNKGKHDIVKNTINMGECVNTFNTLVNTISSTYHLPSLKTLIITKNSNGSQPAPQPKPQPKPQPQNNSKQNKPQKGHPNNSCTGADERLKVKVALENGDGRYTKGLFNKTNMLNFRLLLTIENPDGLRIKSAKAYIKSSKGGHTITRELKTGYMSSTSFNVKTSEFSGNITATVIVEYKIGFIKTKTIKTTVSKNF